jgi:hypothetical protein
LQSDRLYDIIVDLAFVPVVEKHRDRGKY